MIFIITSGATILGKVTGNLRVISLYTRIFDTISSASRYVVLDLSSFNVKAFHSVWSLINARPDGGRPTRAYLKAFKVNVGIHRLRVSNNDIKERYLEIESYGNGGISVMREVATDTTIVLKELERENMHELYITAIMHRIEPNFFLPIIAWARIDGDLRYITPFFGQSLFDITFDSVVTALQSMKVIITMLVYLRTRYGFTHGDLFGGNILFATEGGNTRYILIDLATSSLGLIRDGVVDDDALLPLMFELKRGKETYNAYTTYFAIRTVIEYMKGYPFDTWIGFIDDTLALQ